MLKAGGQDDFGMADAFLRDRFGGVLDQIQHHLNQLVAIGPDRRQRRIVQFLETDMRGEAGLGELSDMLQDAMDVHRGSGDRLFPERLHPVHQVADAVGLVADQFGQFPVGRPDAGFQQLRGAADARQRVFHFMRQDGRHAGDAAGGAAKRQLAIQRPSGRGILHHQEHGTGFLRQRRTLHGDAALVQPRTFEVKVVVGDRRFGAAHLLDQQKQRIVRRQQIVQPMLG